MKQIRVYEWVLFALVGALVAVVMASEAGR
jgi:hypothetical protein